MPYFAWREWIWLRLASVTVGTKRDCQHEVTLARPDLVHKDVRDGERMMKLEL